MKRLTAIAGLFMSLVLAVGCATSPKTPAPNNNAPKAQATDTSLADVQKRGKLLIGMSGQYPPFGFRNDQGQLSGFDVEFTTEVAKRLGVQAEYVTMPFSGLVSSLDSGRFDVIANQMAITPERQQRYDFSTPYVQSAGELLVNKSNTAINSLADVKGKKFAASAGSNYETLLKDAGAEIVHYQTNATIYSDIAAGRIDGTMNDRLQIAYLVKTSGMPLKGVGESDKKVPVALMFRKGSTTLTDAVNKAIAGMMADGTYQKLSNQYFGIDASK